MKDSDRLELELLRNRQQRLGQDLDALAYRIRALEQRLEREDATASSAVAVPPPLPPIMTGAQALALDPNVVHTPRVAATVSAEISQPKPEPAPKPAPLRVMVSRPVETEPPIPPAGAATPGAPGRSFEPPQPKESFEMRLGTYWFVRVGIVLLLTALAFLGNFAYQNYIFKMAASGKVAMLYIVSGLLLGVGAWLQRKEGKESLRNYAQVLFAGGLAAVYFTTYAAHHIERLRVIQSPILDGALLFAWAGFIVWLADRKKSELMALFALGLAYYISTITRTGAFTLYSNLVLTCASVFFLCKNRWAVLSSISLPATYAGYAFWRFYAPTGWRFPGADEGLMFSAAFLGAYWIVFTAAVFLTRHEQLKGGNRALFLSFNNGAALGLFLLTMMQLQTGGLWKVCLGFGTALLALAFLARVVLRDDPITRSVYLTQGLALVTAGLIAKFSGMNLALLLAAESVVVFALGCRLQNTILRAGGWLTALLAVAWVMDNLESLNRGTLYMGMGVTVAMLVSAIFSHHRSAANRQLLRGEVSYFTLLLLTTLGCVIWTHVERSGLAGVLLVTTLVLTLSIYVVRIREVALLGQSFAAFAYVAWLANAVARGGPWETWTQPALLVGVSLALLHWWQHQGQVDTERAGRRAFEAVYAIGIVSVLFTWVMPHLKAAGAADQYAAALAGLVLALTLYSTLTRSGVLAVAAQFLFVPAVVLFLDQVIAHRAPWQSMLVLPVAFFLLAAATVGWVRNRPQLPRKAAEAVARTARVYGWIGLGMLALLIASYVPARNCPWVYALLSIVPFAWAGARKGELLPYSLALMVLAIVAYAAPMRDAVWTHLPNVVFIALLIAEQRVARHLSSRYNLPEVLHRAAMVLGGLSLWLFLSRYVQQNVTGFLLTVAWSVLALILFALGMALRERPYRWLGLAVLGCSLGRVVLLDVWKLHTIYRILSFMALGVVLLLLGYFYNRYQEKIRSWL